MASSKTILDLFQPAAKRLKSLPTPEIPISETIVSCCKSSSSGDSTAEAIITVEQKSRAEFNKFLAISKRNLRICTERVEKAKVDGTGYARLEELLVEESWLGALPGELQKPYAKNLCKFVGQEISGSLPIYPPQFLTFNALNSTPFDRVKAVILGQDPYHGPGQAMGLAFSVPAVVKIPSSLVNIFKELKQDVGCSIPNHGNLERWAVQEHETPYACEFIFTRIREYTKILRNLNSFVGVLLLNTVLTVRNHQANSHAKKGWEVFTDSVIGAISQKKSGVVFLLWGNSAQEKSRLINASKHHILKAAHPSGLSANRGFFGCRHFSKTNEILEGMGVTPIDWQL